MQKKKKKKIWDGKNMHVGLLLNSPVFVNHKMMDETAANYNKNE